jgi:hypothetical protein
VSTWHELAAERDLESALIDTPHWGSIVAEVRRNLLAGHYKDQRIVDAIFQRDKRAGRLTFEEAHCFACVWCAIAAGDIAVGTVTVGGTPYADAQVDDNLAALRRLPQLFDVTINRSANGDGLLTWSSPMFMYRRTPNTDIKEKVRVPAGSLALEIGTTMASRTWMHFTTGFGVARWPYGSPCVVILRRLDWDGASVLPPGDDGLESFTTE